MANEVESANAQMQATRVTKTPKRVYLQPNPDETMLGMQRVAGFSRLGEILASPMGAEKLSHTLRGTVKGRTTVLRSTFYAGKTLEEIAAMALEASTEGLGEEYAYLKEFETNWAKYVSPISIQAPAAYRKNSLMQYATPPETKFTEQDITVACDIVWRFIGLEPYRGALRPLSLQEAMDRLPKDTSWAGPWFTRGVVRDKDRDEEALGVASEQPDYNPQAFAYEAWVDYRPLYLDLASKLAKDLDDDLWYQLFCNWYWRGDIGKPKDDITRGTKQRDVWGYPHSISILESSVYSVLTDVLRGKPGFIAWTDIDSIVSKISENLEKVAGSIDQMMWAFDATGFDKHLAGRLINGVSRNIVQQCFQEQFRPLIERLSQYSQNCGIITPFGIMCKDRGGNRPSGSGGTNLLDCLEQLVMFVLVMLYMQYSEEEIMASLAEVMGDDGSYAVPGSFAEKDVAKVYAEQLGAEVNATKEELSKNRTSFTKRIYQAGVFKGVASACRTMLKLAQYERPTPPNWNEYMEDVRILSSLENLKYHPRFHEVIDVCVSGSRTGLGTRLEGGPLELFRLANYWASINGTSVKQLLDRDDWDRPYKDQLSVEPSSLAVVQYLQERYS